MIEWIAVDGAMSQVGTLEDEGDLDLVRQGLVNPSHQALLLGEYGCGCKVIILSC